MEILKLRIDVFLIVSNPLKKIVVFEMMYWVPVHYTVQMYSDGVTDKLQELLELLFATKNRTSTSASAKNVQKQQIISEDGTFFVFIV